MNTSLLKSTKDKTMKESTEAINNSHLARVCVYMVNHEIHECIYIYISIPGPKVSSYTCIILHRGSCGVAKYLKVSFTLRRLEE